jgi:DNA topoisomerase IA
MVSYLTLFFPCYVDVHFTAKVEEQLDEVSGEWALYLTLFFPRYVDVNFRAKIEEKLDEVSGE